MKRKLIKLVLVRIRTFAFFEKRLLLGRGREMVSDYEKILEESYNGLKLVVSSNLIQGTTSFNQIKSPQQAYKTSYQGVQEISVLPLRLSTYSEA